MHTHSIPSAQLSHRHDFLGAAHDANARRTRWVVALTAAMMVGEVIAGFVTGSMALLADGFHMATHAGALGIAAVAYSYARRHVDDPRFSFGTGKVGELAGFASALILGVVAIGIAAESVSRMLHPTDVDFGDATIVAIIGLAVNIVSAMLLGGGHHHHGHDHDHPHDHDHHSHAGHHPHAHGDNNLRAAYLHVLADALTSILAIVALLAGRYLGWVWMDAAMGIVGALVIARWSLSLMRETAATLLDVTNHRIAETVRAQIEAPGDIELTDLHVWQIGPGAHAAVVEIAGAANPSALRERLRGVREIAHLSIAYR